MTSCGERLNSRNWNFGAEVELRRGGLDCCKEDDALGSLKKASGGTARSYVGSETSEGMKGRAVIGLDLLTLGSGFSSAIRLRDVLLCAPPTYLYRFDRTAAPFRLSRAHVSGDRASPRVAGRKRQHTMSTGAGERRTSFGSLDGSLEHHGRVASHSARSEGG